MKSVVRMLLVAAVLATSSACAAVIAATDDRGVALTLPAPARRIVALAPSIAELVFAAGAGSRLVAVPRYSDYPAEVTALPQIGDASSIDAERVLSLQPDLLIGWKSGNRSSDIARLERLGLKVFVIEPALLTDLPRVLRVLGLLAGTETAAAAAARVFEDALHELRVKHSGATPVRVFYEIWHQPLMTVNRDHMISDVIRLCGGVNIFADLPLLTPVVSLEAVMLRRPQVILGGGSAVSANELAALWRKHVHLAGLRDLPALHIDPDSIQRQTPRVIQGAAEVCAHLDTVR